MNHELKECYNIAAKLKNQKCKNCYFYSNNYCYRIPLPRYKFCTVSRDDWCDKYKSNRNKKLFS